MAPKWYKKSMNDTATRKDIDEVIELMKDFMGKVSDQFSEVNRRLDVLNENMITS